MFEGLSDINQFNLVTKQKDSEPSWFGFMITLNDDCNFSRNEIVEYLEDCNIQTRNLFAGNMLRHPMFKEMIVGQDFRVIGALKNTDKIMNDSFWLGVYPGMKDEQINYMIKIVHEFVGLNS